MKLYRVVKPQHAHPDAALSGEGAAKDGGRWNPRGMAAIYCATTPDTACAEFGYFHLIRPLVRSQQVGSWIFSPNIPGVLVEVDVSSDIHLKDISTPHTLQRLAHRFDVSLTWNEATSPHLMNVQDKTTQLAKRLHKQNTPGLVTSSVRAPGTQCVVIFKDNVTSEALTITHTQLVSFSAVVQGQAWSNQDLAEVDLHKILVKRGDAQTLISVAW